MYFLMAHLNFAVSVAHQRLVNEPVKEASCLFIRAAMIRHETGKIYSHDSGRLVVHFISVCIHGSRKVGTRQGEVQQEIGAII